jgi:hypothetical protein
MTPDKGFLLRSHVPGTNPHNRTGDVFCETRVCLLMCQPFDSTASNPKVTSNGARGHNPLRPRFSFCREKKPTAMTRLNHRTARSTETPPKPLPPTPPARARTQRLQAVQRLATDILSRIEQLLHDDPEAIVDKQSGMLPREIEDSQAYFLQKIQHARTTLQELPALLQLTTEALDARALISTELMVLFVLIDSYRPERILESGWKAGEETQNVIREKIESLGLDVINMRERLK